MAAAEWPNGNRAAWPPSTAVVVSYRPTTKWKAAAAARATILLLLLLLLV